MKEPYTNVVVIAAMLLVIAIAGCRANQPVDRPLTELEPEAASLVREMSADLTAAQSLSFRTQAVRQRVRYSGELADERVVDEVVIGRPAGFFVHRLVDGLDRYYIYDGHSLTFRDDQQKVWARVGAPDNLDATANYMIEILRLPFPTADLFSSDPYNAFIGPETLGRVTGSERIGERKCRHAVFTDPAVDFELWVAEGEPSLPCRMRLIYKQSEGEAAATVPTATVEFSDWQLGLEISKTQFAFVPPEGFERIPVVTVVPPGSEVVTGKSDEESNSGDEASAVPSPEKS